MTPLLFPFTRAFGHTAIATATPLCCQSFCRATLTMNRNTTTKGTCLTIPETENPRGGMAFPAVTARHTECGEVSHKRDADYKTMPLFP